MAHHSLLHSPWSYHLVTFEDNTAAGLQLQYYPERVPNDKTMACTAANDAPTLAGPFFDEKWHQALERRKLLLQQYQMPESCQQLPSQKLWLGVVTMCDFAGLGRVHCCSANRQGVLSVPRNKTKQVVQVVESLRTRVHERSWLWLVACHGTGFLVLPHAECCFLKCIRTMTETHFSRFLALKNFVGHQKMAQLSVLYYELLHVLYCS